MMRKILLSLLSLFIGLSAMGQTVYLAAGQSKSGIGEGNGVIYGIDLSNPQTITEIAFSDETSTIQCNTAYWLKTSTMQSSKATALN